MLPVLTVLCDLRSRLRPILGECHAGNRVGDGGREVAAQVADSEERVDTGDGGLHRSGECVTSLDKGLFNVVRHSSSNVGNGLE